MKHFQPDLSRCEQLEKVSREFGATPEAERSVFRCFCQMPPAPRRFSARYYRDGLFIWPVFGSVTATGNAATTGIDVEGRLLSQPDVPNEIQDAGANSGTWNNKRR